jgi:hypothetical protein
VLAGSAIMLTLSFTIETGRGIASVWAGLVLLFAVVVIVHRVLSVRTVTAQNIYGAVSAYLMIGVAFASFFTAIDHFSGGHFFAQGQPDSTQTFQYFSFSTLTTVGYGDFTAACIRDAGPGPAVSRSIPGGAAVSRPCWRAGV